MNTTSGAATHSATEAVRRAFPRDVPFDSASSPVRRSDMPALSCEIFASSVSTQATSCPNSAKQVPETKPTYPEPIMATRITLSKSAESPCPHE